VGKGKNSNSGRTLERQYEIEQDKLTQTYN